MRMSSFNIVLTILKTRTCNETEQSTLPPKPIIQWVMGALALRLSSQDVRVATHLHLVPRLRISGGIPPFTLHSFMVCIVTTNPFTEVTERSFNYSPLHISLKPPHFPFIFPSNYPAILFIQMLVLTATR